MTRDIITLLEAGTVPWTRPWRTGPPARLLPYNAVTAHEYRGINIPILWRAAEVHDYPTHAWLTYRQARAAGAQVRKGERGTTVVFTKRLRFARPTDDGLPTNEPETIMIERRDFTYEWLRENDAHIFDGRFPHILGVSAALYAIR